MIVMHGETLWSPAPQPMDDDDWWVGWRNYVIHNYKRCDPCTTTRPPKKVPKCSNAHVATERKLSDGPSNKSPTYDIRPLTFEFGDQVWLKNTEKERV